MAEAGLGPSELDLIEDALEELELEGALDRWSADELGPLVRERLTDYRSILAASREALPLEDVPGGVLDGVLAQARQAAAAAPVAAALAAPSWWSRVRRSFMVPALALAGTAVLVFWVFDPADPTMAPELASAPPRGAERDAAGAESAARLEETPARERAAATPTAPLASPSAGVADLEQQQQENKDAAPAEEAEPAPDDDQPAASSKSEGHGRMGSLGEAPGNAALGGSVGAGPASGRWDIVSRGDRARQAGDCTAAREEYALALEDDEARVRARAFAGLGLCDAASGDDVSADANYQRARELDDAVGSFIDSQNQRSRGSAKKSRKPAKKSKMAVDAYDPL